MQRFTRELEIAACDLENGKFQRMARMADKDGRYFGYGPFMQPASIIRDAQFLCLASLRRGRLELARREDRRWVRTLIKMDRQLIRNARETCATVYGWRLP